MKKFYVINNETKDPCRRTAGRISDYLMKRHASCIVQETVGVYDDIPEDADCVTTGDLVTRFCNAWNEAKSEEEPELSWENVGNAGPHEATFLKLDCSLARSTFGWKPVWNIDRALSETVNWTRVYISCRDTEPAARAERIRQEMNREIEVFLSE